MPHLFYGRPNGEDVILDEHETQHLKVVRVKENQEIFVTDGEGKLYRCRVLKIGKDESIARLIESKVKKEKILSLTLCIASQRWERLRWLLEKAVELGVARLVVYKPNRGRSYVDKLDKLNLVIRNAAKQCARCHFPKLQVLDNLDLPVEPSRTFVLHQSGERLTISQAAHFESIIVGPEGDFTDAELVFLRSKYTLFSLGETIFRFETAALLVMGLMYFLNDPLEEV
ncbi:MAG: Ribosomal RNA small subunit methyltransferase E [Thermotoga sp. 50_1627]|uniref:16S rRNA (uracil(1498)-N(3))-methyltransferase n=1 Tax=Pseudothermotoga sp. TaxID=2033661 RepID=UPI00076C0FCA|nr:MAG: Ribosomal RNA small subunit methyltransferase E [Thermotoga sp. 50_64]KUK25308.1 MAG: Ribosomal RNA small subunit methyltransferase E [Thermotoga sp. 50_1627]MBC7116991.1 16S rRNA (uracil(1498)-N(3))-methyltransferase [Pseudothermotoga sp.]HBT39908.1 16S rRNA (uracil(1498)-N(3))-methyltransferase [Pseudothermotoga sp.]HCO97443.1 16S rRNA (uracil(1498)-N(3))-methyltransferase [Pseudothermotoga sp.]